MGDVHYKNEKFDNEDFSWAGIVFCLFLVAVLIVIIISHTPNVPDRCQAIQEQIDTFNMCMENPSCQLMLDDFQELKRYQRQENLYCK